MKVGFIMKPRRSLTVLICVSLIFLILSKKAFAESYLEQDTRSMAEEFTDLFNQSQLQRNMSYKISSAIVADDCLIFLNQNDLLGPLGSTISKNFVEHNSSLPELVNGGEVNSYCRNYSLMSLRQKSLVWVLVLAVVAHYESSCKPHVQAKGPHGTANGLYQLHLGLEQEYDGGQGTCGRNTSSNPEVASSCVLGMLNFQMQKWNGHLFNNKSYWDVLRPNGASHRAFDIQKALMHSNFCNPKTM